MKEKKNMVSIDFSVSFLRQNLVSVFLGKIKMMVFTVPCVYKHVR